MPKVTMSTDHQPTVGLGMPVYNGERFVAEAIRSVLAQSFGDFEIVICDNASTDGTERICREFASQDRRVRYIRNPTNLGAHPNFNMAFTCARGRYFKWVPHDDVLHREYLEACVATLEANQAAVLCQSDLEYIDESGRTIGVVPWRLTRATSGNAAERFAEMVLKPHNCYDFMGLFRRDILASMPLPSFHGADRALLAKMATLGSFEHVYQPLLRIRDHSGRYTRSKTRPGERSTWHDARNAGRWTFPTWRLYGTYWGIVRDMPTGALSKLRSAATLLSWWFVNWNGARMAVDLIANFAPDLVGLAERIKQKLFSPAPGIDEMRR